MAEEAKIRLKIAETAGNHWAEQQKGGCHADREFQKSMCESPKNLWLKAGMMVNFVSQLDRASGCPGPWLKIILGFVYDSISGGDEHFKW